MHGSGGVSVVRSGMCANSGCGRCYDGGCVSRYTIQVRVDRGSDNFSRRSGGAGIRRYSRGAIKCRGSKRKSRWCVGSGFRCNHYSRSQNISLSGNCCSSHCGRIIIWR